MIKNVISISERRGGGCVFDVSGSGAEAGVYN